MNKDTFVTPFHTDENLWIMNATTLPITNSKDSIVKDTTMAMNYDVTPNTPPSL